MDKNGKATLTASSALAHYQGVHDQSGSNSHINMLTGSVTIPTDSRFDYTVSDWLVGSIFKTLRTLQVEGLKPEFYALIGTGETDDQLPIKRFAVDKSITPLLQVVSILPKADLLAALAKIPMPFPSFWLEMPYMDSETNRVRHAYWCRKSGDELRISSYASQVSDKTYEGMKGWMMKEPEDIVISPSKFETGVDLDSYSNAYETGKLTYEEIVKNIELADRLLRDVVATLIILGSKRFNTAVFRPETDEEKQARVKEFRQNRLRLRMGKRPKLPLHPIEIKIGPRLEDAIREKKLKQVKQLLGITSVIAHMMRVRGTDRKVPRREHDRHFPADEPIDRRVVIRKLKALLPPPQNIPDILLNKQPK